MKLKNLCVAAVTAALAGTASADIIWTGSGNGLAAQATFAVVNQQLVVTLQNTATGAVGVPSQVLTGVYFNIGGATVTLTPVSAVLGSGADVVYDNAPAGGNVGGEWAFRSAVGLYEGRRFGISSTGINLFGPGDRFSDVNLAGPDSPDGLQYGLVPLSYVSGTGNGGVTGSGGLIRGPVVFTFGGVGNDFNLNRIGDVIFFYGTAPGEGLLTATPTPGAAALMAVGGLAAARRRRAR